MDILHVYKAYVPVIGGVENHVRALAEGQARAGHRVTVLVTDAGSGGAAVGPGPVRVVRVRAWAEVASTPLAPGLVRALRRERPDVTHVHAPYPPGELAQLLGGRGRPYVVTYHADVTRWRQRAVLAGYRPWLARVLREARRVVVTSPRYAASSVLRPVASRVVVVPLGVNTRLFSPGSRDPAGSPTLLFVGRLRHYKGLDVLFNALRGRPDATPLLVVGDGPMRPGWERLRDRLGLGARVSFLGTVPDGQLPSVYRRADVLVLPATSRAEAYGLVLAEAMASGLPCVTSEVGTGTSWVVQDGVTGLVVPPRDAPALADALARLLGDAVLRRRLGAAGRARAEQELDEATMLARVEVVYRLALDG